MEWDRPIFLFLGRNDFIFCLIDMGCDVLILYLVEGINMIGMDGEFDAVTCCLVGPTCQSAECNAPLCYRASCAALVCVAVVRAAVVHPGPLHPVRSVRSGE